MDEVCIYLNKHVRSTILVFILMGVTYLLLGISDLLKHNTLTGIIEVSIAAIALLFLILNTLPSLQFKLFYCIDKDKISTRVHLFQQTKKYKWDDIIEIKMSKTELILLREARSEGRIRLSSMNYNELQFFKNVLFKFIDLYKIKQT